MTWILEQHRGFYRLTVLTQSHVENIPRPNYHVQNECINTIMRDVVYNLNRFPKSVFRRIDM